MSSRKRMHRTTVFIEEDLRAKAIALAEAKGVTFSAVLNEGLAQVVSATGQEIGVELTCPTCGTEIACDWHGRIVQARAVDAFALIAGEDLEFAALCTAVRRKKGPHYTRAVRAVLRAALQDDGVEVGDQGKGGGV